MDRLILLCRRIYEGVAENQDLFKLIHNLVFGPPQGVPPYDFTRYHRRMAEVITVIFNEGVERRDVFVRNTKEAAFLVLGLIDFCFHMDSVQPESSDPERPERLLRMAFQGLSRADGSHGGEVPYKWVR